MDTEDDDQVQGPGIDGDVAKCSEGEKCITMHRWMVVSYTVEASYLKVQESRRQKDTGARKEIRDKGQPKQVCFAEDKRKASQRQAANTLEATTMSNKSSDKGR